jgi:hypothetical protein
MFTIVRAEPNIKSCMFADLAIGDSFTFGGFIKDRLFRKTSQSEAYDFFENDTCTFNNTLVYPVDCTVTYTYIPKGETK